MVGLALLLLADWPWSTDVRVDDATGTSSQNETAFSPYGGGWNDYRTGAWRYGFSGSTDQGATWMTNQLHHYTQYSMDCDPVLGTDKLGRLHQINLNFSSNGVLVHRMSTDMGQNWSSWHMVSQNGSSGLSDKPWLAFSVSTDTLYVCYILFYTAQDGAYVCRSTNNGTTWTEKRVSAIGTMSRPFICTDKGGNVFVIWINWNTMDYYMSYSTDGGVNYSTPALVTHSYYSWDSHRASMCPWIMGGPPGTVYFVWADERLSSAQQYDILFMKTTNYGSSWSTPVAINTLTGRGHKIALPALAVTPYGDLIAVWAQYASGTWSLQYAYSVNGGTTWEITSGATGRISDANWALSSGGGMEMGDYLTAYADSQYVYALWADDRTAGDYKVYFSKARISDLIPTSSREDAAKAEMGIKQIAGGFVLTLAGNSDVSVEIYDPAGRLVSEAFRGTLEAGEHAFSWPSLNQGVYLATVRVGDRTTSLKFTAR